MTPNDRMAAANGMKILEAGTHADLNVNYFIPREATTLSACNGVTANKEAINLLTSQNWDSLIAGDECCPVIGSIITEITIDTGSIKIF